MSLLRTNLGGEVKPASGGNFGTGAYTSPAITPPSNSQLLVWVTCIENGNGTNPAADLAISDSGGHTWSTKFRLNTSGGFATSLALFTCPIASSATITITLTCGGRNIGIWDVSMVAYTGHDSVNPFGTSQSLISNSAGGGPPNPVTLLLPTPPVATSEIIAAVGADRGSAGVTPGLTFTEIDDNTNPTASVSGGMQTQARMGSTSQSVDWVDIRAGGGALFNYIAAAIEINAGQTVAAPSVASSVGWYGLLSILKERVDVKRARESMPPASCPHDGEPLISDGKGGLKCRFDGWQWPQDGGAIR